MNIKTFLLCLCLVPFVISCDDKKINRVEPDEVIDISGDWNDSDSTLVSKEMIRDSLQRPWLQQYFQKYSKKPVVIVGTVRNNTAEHINTMTFTKSLERAYVNSGNITVVANAMEKEELRDMVKSMQGHVRPETLKHLRRETGADYLLIGYINDIVDEKDREKVKFYMVNLELIHLESHEKAWIGEKKIKKHIKSSKYKLFR